MPDLPDKLASAKAPLTPEELAAIRGHPMSDLAKRAFDVICKKLAPIKSTAAVNATITQAFPWKRLRRYEEALRTIGTQSDAAMNGRDAGSWAKLVATVALRDELHE